MSVPRARLLDLMKVKCRIFATTFNPEGIRTGNKILRQRLRGPALASYYPRRLVTFKDLQHEFAPDLLVEDELNEDRIESNIGRRMRGKAPAKRRDATDRKPDPKKKR